MKPLNIITHIKSNIKRISKTILTLALEFAALTFLISIGVSIINATNYNIIEGRLPKNKNEIVLTKEGLNLCKANLNDMIGTDYNNTVLAYWLLEYSQY